MTALIMRRRRINSKVMQWLAVGGTVCAFMRLRNVTFQVLM